MQARLGKLEGVSPSVSPDPDEGRREWSSGVTAGKILRFLPMKTASAEGVFVAQKHILLLLQFFHFPLPIIVPPLMRLTLVCGAYGELAPFYETLLN